jgi:hypothetical protein
MLSICGSDPWLEGLSRSVRSRNPVWLSVGER